MKSTGLEPETTDPGNGWPGIFKSPAKRRRAAALHDAGASAKFTNRAERPGVRQPSGAFNPRFSGLAHGFSERRRRDIVVEKDSKMFFSSVRSDIVGICRSDGAGIVLVVETTKMPHLRCC